jgi:hypothetical protein
MPDRKIIIFHASWCGWCHKLIEETVPKIKDQIKEGDLITFDTDKSIPAEFLQFKKDGGVPQTVVVERQSNGQWQQIWSKVGFYDKPGMVLSAYGLEKSGAYGVSAEMYNNFQDPHIGGSAGEVPRAQAARPQLNDLTYYPIDRRALAPPRAPALEPFAGAYAEHKLNSLYQHRYAGQVSQHHNSKMYHGQSAAMHGSRHNDNCLCNHAYYSAYSRCQ